MIKLLSRPPLEIVGIIESPDLVEFTVYHGDQQWSGRANSIQLVRPNRGQYSHSFSLDLRTDWADAATYLMYCNWLDEIKDQYADEVFMTEMTIPFGDATYSLRGVFPSQVIYSPTQNLLIAKLHVDYIKRL